MGLDMYLEKHTHVQRWDHIPHDKQYAVTVTRGGEPYAPIKPERVSYVIEQVAYWRKANQIHRWFVENVQHGEDDCAPYYVTVEQLRELLTVVRQAIEVYKGNRANDSALAGALEELLPTERGFFFGSLEYDEDYLIDLEDTRDALEPILAGHEGSGEPTDASYYYRASW